jgi:predicted small metal-binding protein
MNDCPFRCGWTADHASDDEDARAALCIHLEVEHGADPEPDEEAWELLMMSHPLDPPEFRFPSEDENE